MRLLGVCLLALLVARAAPARAALPAGDIVVTANISAGDTGLVLIDPTTGNRTILSDNSHGTGMPFSQPFGVSVTANGDLLVTDMGVPNNPVPVDDLTPSPPLSPAHVYLVDPVTGNRTVLSQDSMTVSTPPYPAIGSGPMFNGPAIARQVGNQFVLTDSNLGALQQPHDDRPQHGQPCDSIGGGIGSGPGIFLRGGNSGFGKHRIRA